MNQRNRITTVLAEPVVGEQAPAEPAPQSEVPRFSSAALTSSAGEPAPVEDGRS